MSCFYPVSWQPLSRLHLADKSNPTITTSEDTTLCLTSYKLCASGGLCRHCGETCCLLLLSVLLIWAVVMQIGVASMFPFPTSLLNGQTHRQTGPGLVQTPSGGTRAQTGGHQTLKGRRNWLAGHLVSNVLHPGQRAAISCLCSNDCKGSSWFALSWRASGPDGLHSFTAYAQGNVCARMVALGRGCF